MLYRKGIVVIAILSGLIISGQLQAQNWELVWLDEFEGDELDESKWSYQHGTGAQYGLIGWGNNELQYYTDRKENIFVEDGKLHIVARQEAYENRNYTSARIRTIHQGDWRYGKFEIRAKLPKGQGLWPAIWMMPTDAVYGGWAASGEIDIMELVGHQPDVVHGTLHYGGGWPDNVHTGDSYRLEDGTFNDDFHTFTLEWEEGEMRWYVDGEHYQTQTNWYTQDHPFPAPFDQRFHLIMNVAVGGDWPGSPDETTVFPQEMVIDYVRVYQDPAMESRIPLPLDFEDDLFDYEGAFTGFDGGHVTVVDNPSPDDVNNSEKVGKMVKDGGEYWGGAWFEVREPFVFVQDYHSVTMNVWSPRADVPVLMKVEQSDGEAEYETLSNTTTSGEWEEMTWDMSGAGFEEEWDIITLIFDFEEGQTGNGSENFTWYFDDLFVWAAEPDLGGPETPADLIPVSLPLTFEERDFDWHMAFFGFDGGNVRVVRNPDPDEVNDSEWVGRMTKGGGAFWGGAFMHLDEPFVFDEENHTISMNVWSPRENVPVLMKVEQQTSDAEYEIAVNTTTSGEWEEMTWDMSGAGFETQWNLITLIFDIQQGQEGDGGEDFTWYFDDLYVHAGELPAFAENTGRQRPEKFELGQNYPNPFNPATIIEYQVPETSYVTLEVYDVTGQLVAALVESEHQSGRYTVTFDATHLASGVYLYRFQAGSFHQTRKMLLLR